MNITIKHTVFTAILTVAMLVAAHTATAGRIERFAVIGTVGAGIGQAVGHNTEATLIGAATALLVDGYFNRSLPNRHHAHRPALHNSHYGHHPSCAARQKTTTVIYLPRGPRPARRHVYRYPHKKEHRWHGTLFLDH